MKKFKIASIVLILLVAPIVTFAETGYSTPTTISGGIAFASEGGDVDIEWYFNPNNTSYVYNQHVIIDLKSVRPEALKFVYENLDTSTAYYNADALYHIVVDDGLAFYTFRDKRYKNQIVGAIYYDGYGLPVGIGELSGIFRTSVLYH
jgi:ABC-type glycerol-3-phosphate transport system substrate-binding protein